MKTSLLVQCHHFAVLVVTWGHVFTSDIPFDSHVALSLVRLSYSFFQLLTRHSQASQCLSDWHNSFTSIATSMLLSYFAKDNKYLKSENRVAFASEMLEDYHSLYLDDLSLDCKVSSHLISPHTNISTLRRNGQAYGVAHFLFKFLPHTSLQKTAML